ncbi:MarR family transcriptional regulator [Nonomuraea sp. K274]|uniref:MarR family transcriptional regulator n=1 Tax=Nonomuraea cypriaca TaxID=1187855 RepID=A0A931EYC5_9ACTN|nr:MarR family transcriptional regulator [Nonomuraea cypriaca]MBF8187175.1 MarR family transcriptional regulator [Nonomuraea cypriaca]
MLVRLGRVLEPGAHEGLRVSFSELCALGELDEAGTLSQQDLAARLGLEKSTVSRLAAGLENKGWIGRDRDPANRRYHRLTLTPAGRAATEQIGRTFSDTHATLFDALTPAERAGLDLGLTGLIRALHTHAKDPGHS